MSGKITPMLSQYLEIKGRHPEAMLLFRMGDFYETFFEDAERLAAITGVVLTSRDRNSAHPVPLAGIPHHALDTYLGRLLEAGLTVAICDQVEDPAQARGLVKREVVQIISPGTAMAPELIRDATGLYCLAFAPGERGEAGWAILDASTGDFRCGQERVTLADLCERHPVREVIVREDTDGQRLSEWRAAQPQVVVNGVSSAWFHPNFAVQVLRDHFRVQSLDPFGLDVQRSALATTAAGALLRYFSGLHLKRPDQIGTLRYSSGADHMLLDEETLRNLEIFRTFRGERGQGTLLFHIDATLTPMGRRLLERRLAEAMTDLAELDRWHGGVEALLQAREWRTRLRGVLRRVGDIERDAARAAAGRRDLARRGSSRSKR
jgi:DNA mismatch repair protein MutS